MKTWSFFSSNQYVGNNFVQSDCKRESWLWPGILWIFWTQASEEVGNNKSHVFHWLHPPTPRRPPAGDTVGTWQVDLGLKRKCEISETPALCTLWKCATKSYSACVRLLTFRFPQKMTLGWNIGALSTGTKHSLFVIPIMLNFLHFTGVHLNSPYPPKKAKLSNNLKPLRDVMETTGSRMAAHWERHQGQNPEWLFLSSLCSSVTWWVPHST